MLPTIFCTKAEDGTILWEGIPLRQALEGFGKPLSDAQWEAFLTEQNLHEGPPTEEEESKAYAKLVERLVSLTSQE